MRTDPAARLRGYSALVGMAPKLHVAYRAWFWMGLFVQVVALTILVFFWKAVYGGRSSLGGLELRQTLSYIMLAQVFLHLVVHSLVFRMGEMLARGQFVMELLRPVDVQFRYYLEHLGILLLELVLKLPLALFAWLVFDLELPRSPAVWGAFVVTLMLGHAIFFAFDWIFACLAFYTTESWGLSMVQYGFATFFSGALVPLALMPDWLERLAIHLPFAQALYVPVSLLAGITPLADAPRVGLIQVAWLVGLVLASRLVFGLSVRKITVQGG